MVAAMGRGGGKTPERVVQKINSEVEKIGQNATARAIGLPLRSVQKYMAGIAEPSQATLEKIARYFGVSVASLRGEFRFPDEYTRLDPKAGGDSLNAEEAKTVIFNKMAEWYQGNNPLLADYIVFCLRENVELRKEVERLLAEKPPDRQNDNPRG